MNHPIQPVEKGPNGVLRFKKNHIVNFLADNFGLNKLAVMDFPREDWEQLAQLIGYSLSGFGDLQYVRESTLNAAHRMAEHPEGDEAQARIAALEKTLAEARDKVRAAAVVLFPIAPEDLHE